MLVAADMPKTKASVKTTPPILLPRFFIFVESLPLGRKEGNRRAAPI
jgi:hypothetical protein